VAEVDEHVGVAMSGLTADARTLIDHGRVETQQHRFTYNEAMPLESLTQSLCDLALRFGEDDEGEGGMSRPFGVALLVAGWDAEGGPVL
jgi:20S proteasome subunit alpha 5